MIKKLSEEEFQNVHNLPDSLAGVTIIPYKNPGE